MLLYELFSGVKSVAFGFVVIDVYNSGEIRIHPEIMRGELQSSQPEVL